MKKQIISTGLITAVLLLTACSGSKSPAPKAKVDYSNKSASFKTGMSDGCQTASGSYTKNSASFNADKDYHDGWFAGRKNCHKLAT
ncbi:MAG: hypothetical protein U9R26_00620 [Campylobacterota bacterium]|nr:hypothetical protein [Campylobacterota bacterium]